MVGFTQRFGVAMLAVLLLARPCDNEGFVLATDRLIHKIFDMHVREPLIES